MPQKSPFNKELRNYLISFEWQKNIKKMAVFSCFYFGKEKSSSIFAPTFAKAECVAKPKGFDTKNRKFWNRNYSVTIPGRDG